MMETTVWGLVLSIGVINIIAKSPASPSRVAHDFRVLRT